MTSINRWIHGQQIGLAAYWVCSPTGIPAARVAEGNWTIILDRFVDLLGSYGDRLETLPPACLTLVRRALPFMEEQDAQRIGTSVDTAAFRMHNRSTRANYAPLARVEAVAHAIMYGHGEARAVIRLGNNLFKRLKRPSYLGNARKNWRAIELQDCNTLEEAIRDLRDPQILVSQRLTLIETIANVIDGVPWCEQVINSLLHHSVAWPLVVPHKQRVPEFAVALPVTVDLDFTGRGAPRIEGDQHVAVRARDGSDFEHWIKRAQDATLVIARKSRNINRAVRDNYKAVFDFSLASRVVQGVLGDVKLPLSGGSASVYLSQMILARLLGRSAYLDSMITGEIGDVFDHGGDYRINEVKGVAAKLKYAFDAQFSDRIVVPYENLEQADSLLARSDVVQTAEVVGIGKLSTVADAVQSAIWRKKVYLRVPEIEWAVHGYGEKYGGCLKENDANVERVLRRLEQSASHTLEMSDVGPRAVISALLNIDSIIRVGDRTKVKPALSWVCTRVTLHPSATADG